MIKRSLLAALVVCLTLVSASTAAPPTRTIDGWLTTTTSCPQAAYVVVYCPCDPPASPQYFIFSTRIDLSQYADHFVSLRGSVTPGNCQAPLFEVKKATIEPNRPCACPALPSNPAGNRGGGPDSTAICTP